MAKIISIGPDPLNPEETEYEYIIEIPDEAMVKVVESVCALNGYDDPRYDLEDNPMPRTEGPGEFAWRTILGWCAEQVRQYNLLKAQQSASQDISYEVNTLMSQIEYGVSDS